MPVVVGIRSVGAGVGRRSGGPGPGRDEGAGVVHQAGARGGGVGGRPRPRPADVLAHPFQRLLCAGLPQAREEVLLLVPDVRGDLGPEGRHERIEIRPVGVEPFEVLEELLHPGVLGDLPVRDEIAVREHLPQRRVEVFLLGDGVPDQLDRQPLGRRLPFPGRDGPLDDVERLVHLTVVRGQFGDDVDCVCHGPTPFVEDRPPARTAGRLARLPAVAPG